MSAPLPLPGLLRGSWRGVPFYMEESRRASGQRKAEFPLAGSNVTLFEDLGLEAGPIQIDGIYIGDDYIAVEAALRRAFEAPGPGILMHPWHGPMLVELAMPGETRLNARRLRMFEIRAVFKRASNPLALILSTLAALAGAASGLSQAASGVIVAGMILPAAETAFRRLAGDFASSIFAGPGGALLSSLVLPALPAYTIDGTAAASWSHDFCAGLAAAGRPKPAAAIAPGPRGRDLSSLVDPRLATRALWGASHRLPRTGPDDRRLLAAGLAAHAMAASAAPQGNIVFESRQDALAWRAQAIAACDDAAARTAEILPLAPQPAGAMWRALNDLRRRIVEDLDEKIGRLPSVVPVKPPAAASAWLVAQHVAGDDPARVVAMMEDIVRRNRLWHPSVAGPDDIEILL